MVDDIQAKEDWRKDWLAGRTDGKIGWQGELTD
jgi:hypothetical protein